jgi:hypothetical protein
VVQAASGAVLLCGSAQRTVMLSAHSAAGAMHKQCIAAMLSAIIWCDDNNYHTQFGAVMLSTSDTVIWYHHSAVCC